PRHRHPFPTRRSSDLSAGNAGLICPSHSTPIANLKSLRVGIGSMFAQLRPRPWKRDSPFYLRPRPAVLPWLARFALAARHWEEGDRKSTRLNSSHGSI